LSLIAELWSSVTLILYECRFRTATGLTAVTRENLFDPSRIETHPPNTYCLGTNRPWVGNNGQGSLRHLHITRLLESAKFRKCGQKDEFCFRILCQCPALAGHREILDIVCLQPTGIRRASDWFCLWQCGQSSLKGLNEIRGAQWTSSVLTEVAPTTLAQYNTQLCIKHTLTTYFRERIVYQKCSYYYIYHHYHHFLSQVFFLPWYFSS
jgi:hypothetical protein